VTAVSVQRPSRRQILVAIIALGAALRLAAAFALPDQTAQFGDAITYRNLGHALWATGRFDTFYFMPLYPALLALTGSGWGQLLLDIGLSTASIWLVYDLSLSLFGDVAAATLAALGVAIYPQFIFFAVIGLTEPLFMALFTAALVCWYRGLFASAAFFAVLSILDRPAIDLLAPVLVVYFALVIHRSTLAQAAKQLAVYAFIYCALIAPWWVHNYRAYGTFVRLDLAGGENFYAGNNPMNTSGGGLAGVDFSTTPFNTIRDPVARDKALYQAGIEFIRQDPKAFLQRAMTKFVRFWRLWPYFSEYSKPFYVTVYFLSYVPVFVLTLVYLLLWGIPEFWRIAPILAFAGYLTLVNIVFVASVRYRMPIEPFMIVFAAAAFARLARRLPAGKALLIEK
jgi:hypothetical protein